MASTNASRFYSRQGANLVDENGARLRWVSFDVPGFHQLPAPLYRLPSPWEQKDAVSAVAQLGGRVMRSGPLSVRRQTDLASIKRNLNAIDTFDEDVFRALDQAIFAAKNQSVRVVVPLIDGAPDADSGGVAAFAAFRNLTLEAFYSNPILRRDWKRTVSYLLNRVNNITGIRYLAEPAIAGWQLGTNLDAVNKTAIEDWAMDMASYIKGEDPNHLIFDGSLSSSSWTPAYLDHPAIDGYSAVHTGVFYKQPVETATLIGLQIALFFFVVSGIFLCVSPKWVKSLREKKGTTNRKINGLLALNAILFALSTVAFGLLTAMAVKQGTSQSDLFQEADIALRRNKASLVSSFGEMTLKQLQNFCTDLIGSGTAGAFLGELTFRNRDGGFYVRQLEGDWWAYSWPGIPPNVTNGFPKDNKDIVDALRYYAGVIQGREYGYPLPEAAPPTILPFLQPYTVRWQGSAGARVYALDRSADFGIAGANATWINLRTNLSESDLAIGSQGWADTTAVRGRTYWYAMKAINEGGWSGLSNILSSTSSQGGGGGGVAGPSSISGGTSLLPTATSIFATPPATIVSSRTTAFTASSAPGPASTGGAPSGTPVA